MTAVEYRREMNRNYMVIRAERGRGGRYAEKMLIENQVPGLLSFHEKQVDDQTWFYYDITSRQPLERILESRALTGSEIRRLISDLLYTLKQMERFLMDEGQLTLNPQYIYVEPDTFQSFLCLIPGEYKCFSEEFGDFSKYLLDHVNHTDTEAVVLAFGIFQESRKANFGMDCVERIINQSVQTSEKRAVSDKGSGEADCAAGENAIPDQRGNVYFYGEDAEDSGREMGLNAYRDTPIRSENMQKGANGNSDRKVWKAVTGFLILSMLLLPAGVVLLQGISAILRYKWILAGAEGSLLVMILTFRKMGNEKKDSSMEIIPEAGIKAVFGDGEPEREYKKDLKNGSRMFDKAENEDWENLLRRVDEPDDMEEELRTVLLTSGPIKEESHRLVPLTGGTEILIPYFPFIIGKSKDLSDFCLDAPGVSRLHLRIDEKENGYTVTDLNSTNGTQVDQKMLQANESCTLSEGEVVKIAGQAYRFM